MGGKKILFRQNLIENNLIYFLKFSIDKGQANIYNTKVQVRAALMR